jgi:hypothetical protein
MKTHTSTSSMKRHLRNALYFSELPNPLWASVIEHLTKALDYRPLNMKLWGAQSGDAYTQVLTENGFDTTKLKAIVDAITAQTDYPTSLIERIAAIRQITYWGLKESKEWVETNYR